MVHIILLLINMFELAESYLAVGITIDNSITISVLQIPYAWLSFISTLGLIAFIRICEVFDKSGKTRTNFDFDICITLQTANYELQTANCKLHTPNCGWHSLSNIINTLKIDFMSSTMQFHGESASICYFRYDYDAQIFCTCQCAVRYSYSSRRSTKSFCSWKHWI